jgi:hypothetical protein
MFAVVIVAFEFSVSLVKNKENIIVGDVSLDRSWDRYLDRYLAVPWTCTLTILVQASRSIVVHQDR